MADYIYFLHDRTTGTVKIGTSTDPEQRMKVLQASSPLDLVPIRFVPVNQGFVVEHALHVRFGHLRVRGEWFRATPELLEFAQSGLLPSEVALPLVETPVESQGQHLTLAQLETKTGISARTIRYYIAEKVLHPPWARGRTAYYDESHVQRLAEVQRLRQVGLTLDDIQRQPVQATVAASPTEMVEYLVASDVRVQLRGRMSPWRKKRVLQALGALEHDLGEEDPEDVSEEG